MTKGSSSSIQHTINAEALRAPRLPHLQSSLHPINIGAPHPFLVYVWSKHNPLIHMSFLGLCTFTAVCLPWLMQLGINLKGFPSSAVHAAFSILIHSGIAAILLLYALFWLKFNLFTTLKVLGFLCTFLVFWWVIGRSPTLHLYLEN